MAFATGVRCTPYKLTIEVKKLATYQMKMDKGMYAGLERGMQKDREEGLAKATWAIAKNLLDFGLAVNTKAQ